MNQVHIEMLKINGREFISLQDFIEFLKAKVESYKFEDKLGSAKILNDLIKQLCDEMGN